MARSREALAFITITDLVAWIARDITPDLKEWEVGFEVHRQVTARAIAGTLSVYARPYKEDGTLDAEIQVPLDEWRRGLRFPPARPPGQWPVPWEAWSDGVPYSSDYPHDLFFIGAARPVYGEVRCSMEELERPFRASVQ